MYNNNYKVGQMKDIYILLLYYSTIVSLQYNNVVRIYE